MKTALRLNNFCAKNFLSVVLIVGFSSLLACQKKDEAREVSEPIEQSQASNPNLENEQSVSLTILNDIQLGKRVELQHYFDILQSSHWEDRAEVSEIIIRNSSSVELIELMKLLLTKTQIDGEGTCIGFLRSCFEELESGEKLDAVILFIADQNNDQLKKRMANEAFLDALARRDLSLLTERTEKIGRDSMESEDLIRSFSRDLLSQASMRNLFGENAFLSNYLSDLTSLRELETVLPEVDVKRMQVYHHFDESHGFESFDLEKISEEVSLPQVEVLEMFVNDPLFNEKMTVAQVSNLLDLIPADYDGWEIPLILPRISSVLLEVKPAELASQIQVLSPSSQNLLLPHLVRDAVASRGREYTYQVAKGITDENILSGFLEHVSSNWGDSGTVGPSLEEFLRLKETEVD